MSICSPFTIVSKKQNSSVKQKTAKAVKDLNGDYNAFRVLTSLIHSIKSQVYDEDSLHGTVEHKQ